jgi:hypothetical protein
MRGYLLEQSPSDAGHLIGRDPRMISASDFNAASVPLPTAMQAIRAKCLDCSGGNASEARKCTAVECPLWTLRMGVYPKARR